MLLRRFGVLAAVLIALSAPVTAASASSGSWASPTSWGSSVRPAPPVLTISGAVSDPVSYTLSQLRALPAETVTVPGPGGSGGVQVTGVSLDRLVTIASPVLPAVKNALLRVVVTASGLFFGHQVSFALGELDPSFGDHDAVIVLSVRGRPLATPALAVPGDQAPVRDLPIVTRIRVGVASPPVTVPPSPGALVIQAGPRQVVLSAAELASLPAQTKRSRSNYLVLSE
jgi:hypothetical protein